jgi:hypothetical protein
MQKEFFECFFCILRKNKLIFVSFENKSSTGTEKIIISYVKYVFYLTLKTFHVQLQSYFKGIHQAHYTALSDQSKVGLPMRSNL